MNDILMSFKVNVKCYYIKNNNILDKSNYRNDNIVELTLDLDKYLASNFIFKFSDDNFINDKYEILIKKYDDKGPTIYIKEIYNELHRVFVVVDYKKLLQDIHKLYNKILVLEKLNTIYNSLINDESSINNDPIDEFDIDPKYGVYKDSYFNNELDCSNYEAEIEYENSIKEENN